MRSFFLFLATLSLFAYKAHSQAYYTTYEWEENPTYTFEKTPETGLHAYFKKVHIDLQYDKGDLVEYRLEHDIYFVNSDEAIESSNKVYLPVGYDAKLVLQKARVITPNGQVLELSEDKLLNATNEETGQSVTYFAFEGVEKGSFIEYYYVVKKSPNIYGNRVSVQAEYPVDAFEFNLSAPQNLVFKFKSFNQLAEVNQELIDERLHWSLKAARIPALLGEEFAAAEAAHQFLIYALDKNLATNAKDITSYVDVAKNLHGFFHQEVSKKSTKKLEKLSKEIGLSSTTEEAEKISKIENYVKRNFYLRNVRNESLNNLDAILETKQANDKGLVHLLIALFNQENIETEIVLTTNRFELHFDPNFESYNFLQNYLIYFPASKTYLAPEDADSRYPYPSYQLTDNYGLFIKSVKVGDFTSAVTEIKYIQPLSKEKNIDGISMKVNFDQNNLTQVNAALDKSFFGYSGMFIHPFIDLVEQENRINLAKSVLESFTENPKELKVEYLNDDPQLFGTKPLRIKYQFFTEDWVEKAGNKYLFKVGKLIGRQVEMYEEKERNLPIAERNHRLYDRIIEVEIPDGYQITNLEDINIENTIYEDEKPVMHFKSYYSVEGNVLKITADEYYQKNHIPVEEYENYRKVINSAADFNEVTLVLEPKP